jgi:hypothetical protein
MKYTVIRPFKDLKDDERIYHVGDVYPHEEAKTPTKARIKELLGEKNAHKAPIIEEVKEDK